MPYQLLAMELWQAELHWFDREIVVAHEFGSME